MVIGHSSAWCWPCEQDKTIAGVWRHDIVNWVAEAVDFMAMVAEGEVGESDFDFLDFFFFGDGMEMQAVVGAG